MVAFDGMLLKSNLIKSRILRVEVLDKSRWGSEPYLKFGLFEMIMASAVAVSVVGAAQVLFVFGVRKRNEKRKTKIITKAKGSRLITFIIASKKASVK